MKIYLMKNHVFHLIFRVDQAFEEKILVFSQRFPCRQTTEDDAQYLASESDLLPRNVNDNDSQASWICSVESVE